MTFQWEEHTENNLNNLKIINNVVNNLHMTRLQENYLKILFLVVCNKENNLFVILSTRSFWLLV